MTLPSATDSLIYAGITGAAVLFVSFTFFPKRTRKTINYLLNAYAEYKQAKEHPEQKIEVPDFETKAMPKVEDPRKPQP